ncbi:GNAT family N-acetyltransferase [Acidihalobacter yilgarnensis]|uniref:GNAT family N-acetyltransferase n=2 Tax=Acidihalobacter yilgarnensis TaxID=2819280 RepID=A0A1D8ISS7_9GAMM|nr:GNAT family N-acetyltransferase [Acidihalobacter yilgarnensis]
MSVVPSFRTVDESEGEELARIRVEAMRESLERIGRFDEARAKARFLSSFVPAYTRAVVIGAQLVGFFVVRPEGRGLLLDHLYVRPVHQGQGIGSLILAKVFAEADAKQQVVKVGALRESRSNEFYVRSGFVLVESAEHDNYYERLPQNVR